MLFGHLLAVTSVLGALAGVWGLSDSAALWSLTMALLAVAALPSRRSWRTVLVALAAGIAQSAYATERRAEGIAPPVALWFRDAAPADQPAPPVRISGRLAEDAAPADGGGIRLTIEVSHVEDRGVSTEVSGRVRLHVGGELARRARHQWSRGRSVEVTALLRWPAHVRNPGSPSLEWQTLARRYVLTGSVKSAALVDVRAGPWWEESAAAMRAHVRHVLGEIFAPTSTVGAITTAILIGDRTALDVEVEDALIEAGTYHVLAISGGNIAILTTLVYAAAGLVCRSARLVSVVTLGVVVTYGWAVVGEPSVARATGAAAIWLLARTAGLEARPLSVLSTVAVIMLWVDPLVVVHPGAWLSFLSTLAILTLAAPCAGLLFGGDRQSGAWRLVVGVLAASVAVQVALIPVAALAFSRVALAAPLLNLVAVPAMTVVQVAGLAAIALWHVSVGAARVAGSAADWGTWAIVASPEWLGAATWLSWRVPPPGFVWVSCFYAAAVAAVAATWPLRLRAAAGVLSAGLVLVLPVVPAAGARAPSGWLRVSMLDVGQGDATVVEFPGGLTLLVDGGNRTVGFDTGDRVVAPALWALGIRQLEWLAMSHPDLDHAGGLPALVPMFDPREVWEGVPVGGERARDDLRRAAIRAGVPWRELRRGDRMEAGGVTVDVVHPPAPDWERRRARNDDSLVLRLRWRSVDVLLGGDIGAAVEQDLARSLSDEPRGLIRILKVPHHGSRTSTSTALLAAYRPHLAVISSGRNNPFGHPAPDVLARLDAAGIETLRTDLDGAVSIETDGWRLRASTWNGRVAFQAFATDARRP